MNFGCHTEVFQIPHHRQYLFVSCNPFWTHALSSGRTKRKSSKLLNKTIYWTKREGFLSSNDIIRILLRQLLKLF